MSARLRQVEEVFSSVVELPPPQRAAALETSCGGDSALRAEVESLLRYADPPATFLSTPPLGIDLATSVSAAEDNLAATMIGPYCIERRIASGGMGIVYEAHRADGQFEQHVAIKIVKRGMDTDQILRQFAQERHNLAALRHPNIARLLDAGAMPNGQPYLVMEFIKGIPINRYCDDQRLTIPKRLRVFCIVCEAVRYAHQKLIVHRDLKPGNILVDERGTPKLLDFGVSKLLIDTAPGEITAAQERRFTPEYASPEQVSGQPLSAASDVYSLGIILFELLTGARPYQFATRSAAEISRVVCEQEIEPPSTALHQASNFNFTSTRTAPLDVVAHRGDLSVARLARRLSGDIDTIVLKATHKDAARRYTSVEQFVADIERHLSGLPVLARPDSIAYRVHKFIRRHAVAVLLAATVVLALASGLGIALWQAGLARQQRDAAYLARDQAEATADFLQRMMSAASPAQEGPNANIRTVLDTAALNVDSALKDQPLVEAAVRSTIGRTYLGLGLLDEAALHIRAAQSVRAALLPPGHHDLAESEFDLAQLAYARGEYADAEKLLSDSLATHRRLRGAENLDTARVLNDLGAVQRAGGKIAEAHAAHREALRIREKLAGRESLDVAESLNNLSGVLLAKGNAQGAELMMEEVLQIRRRLLRPEHPLVIQSIANLAVMVASKGDLERGEELLREVVDLDRKVLGNEHPSLAVDLAGLGRILLKQKKYAQAEPVLRETVAIRRERLPADDLRTLLSEADLGRCVAKMDRLEEAEPLLAGALTRAWPQLKSATPQWLVAAEELERIYELTGRANEAEDVRAMKASLEK